MFRFVIVEFVMGSHVLKGGMLHPISSMFSSNIQIVQEREVVIPKPNGIEDFLIRLET